MRSRLIILVCCLFGAGCGKQQSQPTPVVVKNPNPITPPESLPKIPVGKDTTYVDGPLDKDGYVDYVAALNERMGKGVTKDNNAVVLLWQAIGPKVQFAEMTEYYKLLGIDIPDEQGLYFIDLDTYVKEEQKLDQEKLNIVQFLARDFAKKPWKAESSAVLNDWLFRNEKPLDIVVQAVNRSKYYQPMLPPFDKDGRRMRLFDVPLPISQKQRSMAQALAVRAMHKLGTGQVEAAWTDIRACYRLARQAKQGWSLIENLVGSSIERTAIDATIALLADQKTDSKLLMSMAKDLSALLPNRTVAEVMLESDRFTLLEYLQTFPKGLQTNDLVGTIGIQAVEWEHAFRHVNQTYEHIGMILNTKDYQERKKAIDQFGSDLLSTTAAEIMEKAKANAKDLKFMSESIGKVVVRLMLPAFTKVADADDSIRQHFCNAQIAIALAAYQADHKRYPEKLDDLAPKYIAKVPVDLFSGKAVIYKPDGAGYLLYSVGPNVVDDGGRSLSDTPKGDDIVVRMPPK